MAKSPYLKSHLSCLFPNASDFRQFLAQKVKLKMEFAEYKNLAGDLIPYHAHKEHEVLILLSGKLRAVVEEEIVDLECGEILIIEPYAIHLLTFPESDSRYFRCSASEAFWR
ncbi:MAG: cupin domain-containing protein [Leptospiraceae bacterium]|nr:cupin domain-containing protein [Leptospiraceae bacterium]MDW8305503.1 cupin domain-containing protein [Leptospiraceae bacterium]